MVLNYVARRAVSLTSFRWIRSAHLFERIQADFRREMAMVHCRVARHFAKFQPPPRYSESRHRLYALIRLPALVTYC